MTSEERAAYINAKAVAASITMQGMIAANTVHSMHGCALAYGEDMFLDLIKEFGLDEQTLRELLADADKETP